MKTLLDLIQQYRQEYEVLHPNNAAFGLQPTVAKDVFGNPIQTLGSLDQLEEAVDRGNFQKERDTWVFCKILDETEGKAFEDLIAIMGNPNNLHPCDGFLWPQCTFFCEDYPNCNYAAESLKASPKVESKKGSAVGGSTETEKPGKKKRRKRKKNGNRE